LRIPNPVALFTFLLIALPLQAAEEAEQDELSEIIVQAPEPRYVAPTNRDRIGRVWVPVMINDKGPFRLVLDSGATHSAVIPSVASVLQIPLNRSPPVMLRGVTGTAVVPAIRVDSLSVGDLLVAPSTLPVVNDVFGGAQGLLGVDGMADKRIYIDFRNDFINVSYSKNRRAAGGFDTVPFLKTDQQLLMVNARIGNLNIRAIIDTGAQASVGNEALRAALASRYVRKHESVDEITGATGDVQPGTGANLSTLSIGSLTLRGVRVTFGDMRIFEHWHLDDEPILLIGMDVIGLLDTLVIDYRRRELQIRARISS
jgi:predicted aspartyl protease